MICKSYIRSVIVQAGHIVTSTKARVHFNNTDRFCMLANSRNRAFRASLRMMVDTGATDNQGSVFDVLPDKDEDGEYTSGGCKSEGGKLSCGYSSFRGKRATMEDFYDVKMSKIDGQTVCLFGIFDGHGGSRAAQYLKEHLFDNLMKHPQFMIDTKLAISESYQQTDADFLDSERDTYRDDGSTASTAVLVGNHLYVANVGDSRTVISKAGKAIALSEDHKPNRSDERKRIESAGGVVMWAGTWRVGGVLAMSRAFGNRMLKQYVVAEPEIQDQVVDEDFEFLVLASDGVWDVLTNEVNPILAVTFDFDTYADTRPFTGPFTIGRGMGEFFCVGRTVVLQYYCNDNNPGSLLIYLCIICQVAVEVAKTEEEPEAAARKLTAVAFCRGSADNITCIVVKFQHDKAEPASAHQD